MAWWSIGKNKFKGNKNNGNKSVAEYAKQKNAVVSEYSLAMDRLKSKVLTVEERFYDLLKTYRDGKDLMVVPLAWKDRDMIVSGTFRKVFVDTPVPSIVRTR